MVDASHNTECDVVRMHNQRERTPAYVLDMSVCVHMLDM